MKPKTKASSASDKIYNGKCARLPHDAHARKIIHLYDDGFNSQEISDQLGLPIEIVSRRIRVALERSL